MSISQMWHVHQQEPALHTTVDLYKNICFTYFSL